MADLVFHETFKPTKLETKTLVRVGLALLCVDLLFIALHIARSVAVKDLGHDGWLTSTVFSLEAERSYSEIFGYLKLWTAATLLFWLSASTRQLVYLSWSLILILASMDDLFGLHEWAGGLAVAHTNWSGFFGLRPFDYGQMLFWAGLGVVAALLLFVGYRKSGPRHRQASLILFTAFACLVFFGAGVDMMRRLIFHITNSEGGFRGLGTVEEGGELIALTLLLLGSLWIYRRIRRPRPSGDI